MNASAISPAPIDELALVSSLYGIGPVVGWLLSSLSVLLSWIVATPSHQEPRLSPDFVATTLFPAVAIGDLVLQLARFPLHLNEMSTTSDATMQQRIHALEAPLALLECFMIMSVPLMVMAWFRGCEVKTAIIAFIYASNVVIELALFEPVVTPASYFIGRLNNFNRAYLMNDWRLWYNAVCLLLMLGLVVMLEMSCASRVHRDPERSSGFGHRNELANWCFITGSLLLIPWCLTFLSTRISPADTSSTKSLFGTLPALAKGFTHPFPLYLLPRARGSIADLDQIVPVLGGAYILALNIYNLVREVLQKPVTL